MLVLAPRQHFLASTQVQLAPRQHFLALNRVKPASRQAELASNQEKPASNQVELAARQVQLARFRHGDGSKQVFYQNFEKWIARTADFYSFHGFQPTSGIHPGT